MYDIKPNLIIGFHGCERNVRDALLLNPSNYKISQKPFDWLGHGLYFWENNYDRALEWATDKKKPRWYNQAIGYRGGIVVRLLLRLPREKIYSAFDLLFWCHEILA